MSHPAPNLTDLRVLAVVADGSAGRIELGLAGGQPWIVRRLPRVADATEAERLRSEGRLAQALVACDVSPIRACGEDATGPGLLLEPWPALSVMQITDALRASTTQLSVDFALEVGRQLAARLAALRRVAGGPHGGVRPSNVLVGFDGRVKLAELRGREPRPRPDSIAIGRTICELLTLRAPGELEASDPAEHRNDVPPEVSELLFDLLSASGLDDVDVVEARIAEVQARAEVWAGEAALAAPMGAFFPGAREEQERSVRAVLESSGERPTAAARRQRPPVASGQTDPAPPSGSFGGGSATSHNRAAHAGSAADAATSPGPLASASVARVSHHAALPRSGMAGRVALVSIAALIGLVASAGGAWGAFALFAQIHAQPAPSQTATEPPGEGLVPIAPEPITDDEQSAEPELDDTTAEDDAEEVEDAVEEAPPEPRPRPIRRRRRPQPTPAPRPIDCFNRCRDESTREWARSDFEACRSACLSGRPVRATRPSRPAPAGPSADCLADCFRDERICVHLNPHISRTAQSNAYLRECNRTFHTCRARCIERNPH